MVKVWRVWLVCGTRSPILKKEITGLPIYPAVGDDVYTVVYDSGVKVADIAHDTHAYATLIYLDDAAPLDKQDVETLLKDGWEYQVKIVRATP